MRPGYDNFIDLLLRYKFALLHRRNSPATWKYPFIPYLAVNYIDWFISKQEIPVNK
jgi:hypothetical protein